MGVRFGFSFLLLVLVGCGRAPTPEEVAEFEPYFQRFEAYSARFGRDTRGDDGVKILFSPLGKGVAGLCEETTFQAPKVLVNPTAWAASSDPGKEALILHELGHCVLGRDHRNESMTSVRPVDGRRRLVPASLMHLQGVTGSVYLENKDYYLSELFTGK